MRYFKVMAKCGHVGRNRYIVKEFFIAADDGKAAAYKVRYFPRVKHDRKDAILSVEAITEVEYLEGRAEQADDPYFRVHSSTEQRRCGAVDYDRVISEEVSERKKSKKSIYYRKLARMIRKDTQRQLAGEI